MLLLNTGETNVARLTSYEFTTFSVQIYWLEPITKKKKEKNDKLFPHILHLIQKYDMAA